MRLSQRLKLNNDENGKIRTIKKWNETTTSWRHCREAKSVFAMARWRTDRCTHTNWHATVTRTIIVLQYSVQLFSLPHLDIIPNCSGLSAVAPQDLAIICVYICKNVRGCARPGQNLLHGNADRGCVRDCVSDCDLTLPVRTLSKTSLS